MTQAHTLTGNFAIDSAVLATVQLTINWSAASGGAFTVGTTNLPPGANASVLCATSLLNAVWQTSATFTAASTAKSWTLPATANNAFYRLRFP